MAIQRDYNIHVYFWIIHYADFRLGVPSGTDVNSHICSGTLVGSDPVYICSGAESPFLAGAGRTCHVELDISTGGSWNSLYIKSYFGTFLRLDVRNFIHCPLFHFLESTVQLFIISIFTDPFFRNRRHRFCGLFDFRHHFAGRIA